MWKNIEKVRRNMIVVGCSSRGAWVTTGVVEIGSWEFVHTYVEGRMWKCVVLVGMEDYVHTYSDDRLILTFRSYIL